MREVVNQQRSEGKRRGVKCIRSGECCVAKDVKFVRRTETACTLSLY